MTGKLLADAQEGSSALARGSRRDQSDDCIIETDLTMLIPNSYASETAVKTADLLDERAVEQMRTKLLADFGEGARVVDNARTELFATGGLLMRYERTRGAITWRHDFYLVPAEKHLQYFEVVSTADEPNAQPIVEAVLRSFDGAKEGDTLQGMILGGVAGAIGGALVATWLGRRRRAALAAAGTAAGPGANAS